MARWRFALAKGLAALVIALLVILLPLPLPQYPLAEAIKNGAITIILVCYLGKLLYDTLFYPRYWP